MRERSEDVSRDALIAKLQKELIISRRISICNKIITSETYCQIEKGNSKMAWSVYLALLLFFRSIPSTSELLTLLGIEVEGILYDLNDSVRKKLSSGNLMNFLL